MSPALPFLGAKNFTCNQVSELGIVLWSALQQKLSCHLNALAELLMRAALDGFSGGFQIGGRILNNLRYADDIVLVASSEAELQELVTRFAASDTSMRINVKKTEVIVCTANEN